MDMNFAAAGHQRNDSMTSDSDFGSFVSVDDHPLGLDDGPLTPPPHPAGGLKALRDDTKLRAESNERRILAEMQAHERDPLAWIQATQGDGEMKESRFLESSEEKLPKSILDDVQSLSLEPDAQTDLQQDTSRPPSAHPQPDFRSFEIAQTQPSAAAKPLEDDVLQDLDPLSQPGPSAPTSVTQRRASNIQAQQSKNDVLAELRKHEEDPRRWLQSTKQQEEEDLPRLLREASSTSIEVAHYQPPRPSTPPPPADSSSVPIPRTSSDTHLLRNQRHASPSRASPTQSTFASSRSWMSSLGLLGSSRAAPSSPSPSSARGSHEHIPEPGSGGLSPTQSSLHNLFARGTPASPISGSRLGGHARYATEGHHPLTHAATVPLPTPQAESSPFAAPTFIPPSGAPGYTGERNWNKSGFEFDVKKPGEVLGKGVSLVGRNSFTNPVLDEKTANSLRRFLPALARLPHTWTLLFSGDQHGLSLNTLYNNCAPEVIVGGGGVVPGSTGSAGTLLAVQDGDDGVFGAWIADGMHLSHGSYYGGGDSFLWKADKHASDGSDVRVFKWTGRNDYVALCDLDGFSFGGGDGHYGLYIDASLIQGTTHPCPTFDNVCLASGEKKGKMVSFDAVGIEVWGVGP